MTHYLDKYMLDKWPVRTTPTQKLEYTCFFWYGVVDIHNKFIDVLNPTENEKVLFCLEYSEDAYKYITKSAKKIYEEHNKLTKDIKTLKLKAEKVNKRNKHVNKQKMNPYYQKEEWKK